MQATVQRWLRRMGWLVGIWLASVTVLAFAAWALRLLMQAVGMSTP